MRGSLLVHPVHPALAHFPLAFWIGSSVSDLLALWSGNASWWTVSHHAVAAGVIMGAATLVVGALELWLRKVPRGALRWLIVHASCMSAALLCFMISLSWRTVAPPPLAAVAMSCVGSLVVLVGGYCGGALVYRFGVGVSWRIEENG